MFWICKPSVFQFYYFNLLSLFFQSKTTPHFLFQRNFQRLLEVISELAKLHFDPKRPCTRLSQNVCLNLLFAGIEVSSLYRLLFRFSITCDICILSLVTIQVKKLSLCFPNRVRKTTHSLAVSFCVCHVSVFRIQHMVPQFPNTSASQPQFHDRSGNFSKSDKIGMVCSQSLIDWVARFHASESCAPSGFGPINASFFRYYPTGKPFSCSYNLLLNQNNVTLHMSQYF